MGKPENPPALLQGAWTVTKWAAFLLVFLTASDVLERVLGVGRFLTGVLIVAFVGAGYCAGFMDASRTAARAERERQP